MRPKPKLSSNMEGGGGRETRGEERDRETEIQGDIGTECAVSLQPTSLKKILVFVNAEKA